MKIITYSDLHLEFEHDWFIPEDINGDVLILAGDIISFSNFIPLRRLLSDWKKPVIYVAGNHEYYTQTPINIENEKFKKWLSDKLPQVTFLNNESVCIDGVHFFGGTMWTDFNNDPLAMINAKEKMNDFNLIYDETGNRLSPEHSVNLHKHYVQELQNWFKQTPTGKHVVISHHAPVEKIGSLHKSSPLIPAFNSLDMINIIEQYRPDYWIYGHTHECDEQVIGSTKIVSNQLGYPNGLGRYECLDFDPYGKIFEVKE